MRNYIEVEGILLGKWKNRLDIYVLGKDNNTYTEIYLTPNETIDLLIAIIKVFENIINDELIALDKEKEEAKKKKRKKELEDIKERQVALTELAGNLLKTRDVLMHYYERIADLLPYRDD